MGTLQSLRNKGPLLIIFVGIALFAFIAGDAVKLFESNTVDTSVGTVGETEVQAVEFQELLNEQENFYTVLYGSTNMITEEQKKAEAWNLLSVSKVFGSEAEKLGISVTSGDIKHYLENNKSNFVNSFIRESVMAAQRTGQAQTNAFVNGNSFNMEILNEVINSMNNGGEISQATAIYFYCWKYIERNVTNEIIQSKLQTLYQNSTIANPAIVEKGMKLGKDSIRIEVARFNTAALLDTIKVSDDEIVNYYESNKRFRTDWMRNEETRDIKYVKVNVRPSDEDIAAIKKQMQECSDTLKAGFKNYDRAARLAHGNCIEFPSLTTLEDLSALNLNKDIVETIRNTEVDSVTNPFRIRGFESNDRNEYFCVVTNAEKVTVPEKIGVRYAVIYDKSDSIVNATVDTLVAKLAANGDFKELTKGYEIAEDSVAFATTSISKDLNGKALLPCLMQNDTTMKAFYEAPVNTYQTAKVNLIPGAHAVLVYQIYEKSGSAIAYKPVIINKEIVFSNNTYNKTYNEFSKTVGGSKDAADFEKKVKESKKYYILRQNGVTTSTAAIASTANTSSFIKWIFDGSTKVDGVSEIKKCGENDCFMVMVLDRVNPKGYVALNETVNGISMYETVKNELKQKKAEEMAVAQLKGKTFEQVKTFANVQSATVDQINFNESASIPSWRVNDASISAVAAKLDVNQTSEPFKGNNGVYVVKVISKTEKKDNTYNQKTANEEEKANSDFMSVGAAWNDEYQMENKVYKHF